MDINEDIELLWIADEALQAEDPEGWDQAESPNGDIYYIHSVTQQILWQHPLDYSFQQKYIALKGGAESADVADMLAPSAIQAAAASTPLPDALPPPSAPAPPLPPPLAPPGSSGTLVEGVLKSDDQLRARLQQLLGTPHSELRNMLIEPACTSQPVHCYVMRHKSRVGAPRYDFFMSLSSTKDMYCFTGKKERSMGVRAGGATYTLSLDQDDSRRAKESTIGKIKVDRKSMECVKSPLPLNPLSITLHAPSAHASCSPPETLPNPLHSHLPPLA
jgi:hypothetical protein